MLLDSAARLRSPQALPGSGRLRRESVLRRQQSARPGRRAVRPRAQGREGDTPAVPYVLICSSPYDVRHGSPSTVADHLPARHLRAATEPPCGDLPSRAPGLPGRSHSQNRRRSKRRRPGPAPLEHRGRPSAMIRGRSGADSRPTRRRRAGGFTRMGGFMAGSPSHLGGRVGRLGLRLATPRHGHASTAIPRTEETPRRSPIGAL